MIIIPFLNGYFIGNIPYFQTNPLGGELPTNRGCGLVNYPVIDMGFLERVNPLKKLGWTNPLTIRGMSHQVASSIHLPYFKSDVCPILFANLAKDWVGTSL